MSETKEVLTPEAISEGRRIVSARKLVEFETEVEKAARAWTAMMKAKAERAEKALKAKAEAEAKEAEANAKKAEAEAKKAAKAEEKK